MSLHRIIPVWFLSLWAIACLPLAAADMATAPAAEGTEVHLITLPEGIATLPARVRRRVQQLTSEMDAGQRVRVTLSLFFEFGQTGSSNTMQPYVQALVPLDREDRPHGIERFYHCHHANSYSLLREIPWKHGKRHGVERIFTRGHLETEIPWVNGVIQGNRKTFYPDGSVRSVSPYVDGVPQGRLLSFDQEENITRESFMEDGRLHGILTDYWPGTDQPRRIIPYQNGRVHGTMRAFYANGNLRTKAEFVDGLRHGSEIHYEVDGSVIRHLTWENDEEATPNQ